MKSFLKQNYLLIIIITLAIGLRFFRLGSNPIGFNDDEAAFGFNAYSIIKSLHDEWGRFLPFPVFESFGDWKLVLYLYLTVLSQLIFGATEFATRLPSAIIGTLAVFSTYLLTKKLFDKRVGLLSALLLAISPWHIIASRNAFESDILIFFITTSTLLFLKGLKDKRFLKLSFLGFIMSFYVYRSSWLFVPLFVVALLYIFRDELKAARVPFFKYMIVSILLLLPLLPTVLTFKGQSRFFQESFIYGVSKTGIINEINEKRGICYRFAPQVICNLIYNRYSSFITTYVNNYFENLSPSTYFTKGIAQGYQSFSNRGLLYSFELPLLAIGLFGLLLKKDKPFKILATWILLVPLGASFTGVGNPGRLNIIMPAIQIIEAFGFFFLVSIAKKLTLQKIIFATLFVVVAFSVIKLLTDMFFYYPQISGRAQRYGYKELFTYIYSQKENYTQIAVSRRGDDAKQYIHYLFFNKIDPLQFIYSDFTKRHRDENGWQVVEQIGNVTFYSSAPPLERLPEKSLLAVSEKEVNFPTTPIYKVYYPNKDTFFEIYDVDEVKSKLKEQK